MGRIFTLGISGTGAAAALTLSLAAAPAGGTIVGVVSTTTKLPAPIRVSIDPGVCGATLPDESVVVDGAGHLAGAVLTVAGVKAAAPAEAAITNDKCRFVPHVSLLKPNGSVTMTSKDNVLHTMHAAGGDARALFNISLPIPNMKVSKPIDKPGVVALTCSTHTWMRGYLFVTDELSAISAADGAFKLENVPAGTHEIRVWHEALKVAAPLTVTVKDGETVTLNVTMK